MTVFLFKPPRHTTGVYSGRLSAAMSRLGVPAECRTAGSDRLASMARKVFPDSLADRLLGLSTKPPFSNPALRGVRPGDAAWVYTNRLFADRALRCPFENALKKAGAKYVFHLPDAWPVLPRWKRHVDARIRLADFVATVTPALTELVRKLYPGVPCGTCEEAVPTEDFEPDFETVRDRPVVVWSGPPAKIREVEKSLPVLESAFRQCPFVLRIVSGNGAPEFSAPFPVQWIPFFGTAASARFRGTDIAFARYADTPYGGCKGNYKVKTYLAAGCAVVTDPVGYNLDMIRPGVNGLFASTADEWEAALLRLLRDSDGRLAMRKAARETAVRRFSYAAIAEQYAGVLRDLGWV